MIDKLDRDIIDTLLENADMPYTEVAKKLFVSSGTIHVRMKKLQEQLKVVRGSQLDIDYTKLGYDITAFIGIFLEKSSLYETVTEKLKTIPEIVSAHYTTGNYSIFARIVCKDTNHLRSILSDKVQNIKGIQRTETFISLDESIDRRLRITSQDDE
jgi:Lrp/AsnC family transcriptional regulator for asnA, asnC and gidA